jgi:hypothetical protein
MKMSRDENVARRQDASVAIIGMQPRLNWGVELAVQNAGNTPVGAYEVKDDTEYGWSTAIAAAMTARAYSYVALTANGVVQALLDKLVVQQSCCEIGHECVNWQTVTAYGECDDSYRPRTRLLWYESADDALGRYNLPSAAVAGLRAGMLPYAVLDGVEIAGLEPPQHDLSEEAGASLASVGIMGLIRCGTGTAVYRGVTATRDDEVVAANTDAIVKHLRRNASELLARVDFTQDALRQLRTRMLGQLNGMCSRRLRGGRRQLLAGSVRPLRKHVALPRFVANIELTVPDARGDGVVVKRQIVL